MIFAVLPGVAAWTINLIAVGVVSGTGVYVLLRVLRCGPLGAVLAGLCFTYTGFMSGQLDHIGLVEGTGYVAWMLVAIELLTRSSTVRSASWPLLLLALSSSLCVLSGEPRAVSSAVIVVGVYLLVRMCQLGYRRGLGLFITTIIGAGLGVAISAIQWLPGLTFIARSQRTLDSYQSFGAGSLTWITISHNLLVPFMLGGNGNFGLSQYVGGYNLPEVTIGVGLLPLVAFFGFLPEQCMKIFTSLRLRLQHLRGVTITRNESGTKKDLGLWYALALIGFVLTLGSTTPIGRLLVNIPLYGGERLQNRNAVIFDFALAVIFGFFVDEFVSKHPLPTAQTSAARNQFAKLIRRFFCLIPIFGCIAFIVIAYLEPIKVQRHLGVAKPNAQLFLHLTRYLVFTIVLSLAIALFIFVADRINYRLRVILLSVLACVDIGVYVINASYSTTPSAILAGPKPASEQLAKLTDGGRFAIYNPLVRDAPGTWALGETDLNILRGQMSVQGYSSIVGGTYQDITETHIFESLDPSILNNDVANTLNLRVLLTLPIYLDEALPIHSAIPVAGGPPVTLKGKPVAATDAPSSQVISSGPWTITPHTARIWRLPSVSTVRRLAIVINKENGVSPPSLNVQLGTAAGSSKIYSVPVVNGQAHLMLPKPTSAESVTISAGNDRATVGAVVVVTRSPDERLLLDGSLQGHLSSSQWSYAGVIGTLSVFVNHDAAGLAWLQPATSKTPAPGKDANGAVTTTVDATTGSQQMLVTAKRRSILVRSVAYQQGWTAELTPQSGGPTTTAKVEPLGLLQSISIPAGRYRVSWLYASRSLVAGGALTLGSIAIFFMLVTYTFFDRRRRRSSHHLHDRHTHLGDLRD
jgi:hypothetical protein